MIFDILWGDYVIFGDPKLRNLQKRNPIIQFSMVVGAKAENVADNVRAVMRAAKGLDVMSLSVFRAIEKCDGISAHLACIFMNGFHSEG